MNLFLENVNLNSSSGPNHFAQKLVKYLGMRGVSFDSCRVYDKKLTFIQSNGVRPDLDMYLRLDGIYFNSNFNCSLMNYNIKKSYKNAKGIIFQTEFNKNLIFNWFGPHDNYVVIPNGADTKLIQELQYSTDFENKFKTFGKIWSCAADWHPYKRLEENIKYFLTFSQEQDILLVAGKNPDYKTDHPRIKYLGNLSLSDLMTVYKISDYFIHLAYLDHCPNVVIDARAHGCKIICSSSGGTKEIAGLNCDIVIEDEWDYRFIEEKVPPKMNFSNIVKGQIDSDLSMVKTAKKYHKFLKEN